MPIRSIESELSQLIVLILKGTKVVSLAALRLEMLNKIYEGHPVLYKTKCTARALVFGLALVSDIGVTTRSCHVCKICTYLQPCEPLLTLELPGQP